MKRKCLVFLVIFSMLLAPITPFNNHSKVFAQTNQFKWVNIKQVQITAQALNVRTGPSTKFRIINQVRQGQIINVMGALGSWYVVHLPDNSVGCISSTYTRVYKYINPPQQQQPKPEQPAQQPDQMISGLTAQEKQMFDLVNKERKANGLPAYQIDMNVVKVARVKAKDMSDNNYFSHYSPTYGSPFDMMKKYGIKYQAAAENIAANSNVDRAHTSLMNSPGHRTNILSSRYTHIGIGIVPDKKYGIIVVQMFKK